jgi:hypothetical protein
LLPEAGASALWNLAYDAGYGAGPAVFGLFAARTGYPAAFAMTGVLVLAVLPAAVRERRVEVGWTVLGDQKGAAHRLVEHRA